MPRPVSSLAVDRSWRSTALILEACDRASDRPQRPDPPPQVEGERAADDEHVRASRDGDRGKQRNDSTHTDRLRGCARRSQAEADCCSTLRGEAANRVPVARARLGPVRRPWRGRGRGRHGQAGPRRSPSPFQQAIPAEQLCSYGTLDLSRSTMLWACASGHAGSARANSSPP